MNSTLLGVGIACIAAAIVGGGLKMFAVEIPALNSLRRQILLGLFGILLVLVSQINPASGNPSADERKLVMEVSHRATMALQELDVDEKDITSAKVAPYVPASIYYNSVRYLNNSFPDEASPPDYSVFPEFRTLDFKSLLRRLVLLKGEKQFRTTWNAFERLEKLGQGQNEKLDKQKCLEAVANARHIITSEILGAYFKSSID